MTPIQLVYKIAERIEDIVKNYLMEESNTDSDGKRAMRAPKVWTQNLPEKLYENVPDPADYPFVLVMLGGGNGVTDNKMPCSVAILVGGYDDGQVIEGGVRDRQGWLLPAEMAWRIITSLAVDPVIGAFALDLEEISWELPGQEQPAPQWFGIINTTWTIPVPRQTFDLQNMDSYVGQHCDAALIEDINT